MTGSDSIRKGRRRHPFLHDLYPRLTNFTSLLAAYLRYVAVRSSGP